MLFMCDMSNVVHIINNGMNCDYAVEGLIAV